MQKQSGWLLIWIALAVILVNLSAVWLVTFATWIIFIYDVSYTQLLFVTLLFSVPIKVKT